MSADKDVHPMLKGYMYPSTQVARCPRHHRCLISGKCQSYDPHQADCAVCETRVLHFPEGRLGGVLPEGKYIPDLQDAIKTIEENMKTPFADRNAKPQDNPNTPELTRKWERMQRSVEMCKTFMDEGIWKLEEKVTTALYDVEKKKLLGRLE